MDLITTGVKMPESEDSYICRTGFTRKEEGDFPVTEKERKEACSRWNRESLKIIAPYAIAGTVGVVGTFWVLSRIFPDKVKRS